MAVTTIFFIAIIVVVFKLITAFNKTKADLLLKINSFNIARYALQLSVLKNILRFFKKGGDTNE